MRVYSSRAGVGGPTKPLVIQTNEKDKQEATKQVLQINDRRNEGRETRETRVWKAL